MVWECFLFIRHNILYIIGAKCFQCRCILLRTMRIFLVLKSVSFFMIIYGSAYLLISKAVIT